ncbi:MAG: 16S rRNA processing protein RimM [Clostridia bacterium]|nr:16S rRNA processing protein RimM [Clostridia bacterium]
MMKETKPLRNILHIGRIIGAHGLKGELKVLPLTDDPKRFLSLKDCLLVTDDEKERVPAQAEGARFSGDQVLLSLKGVSDRTAAEQLKGRLVSVTREHAVALPPDTWFICDLLGCEVHDKTHGFLGQLKDVQTGPAQDVYVVTLAGQKDLLFPARKTILRQVDLELRRIDVDLPDGLFEIYRES